MIFISRIIIVKITDKCVNIIQRQYLLNDYEINIFVKRWNNYKYAEVEQ